MWLYSTAIDFLNGDLHVLDHVLRWATRWQSERQTHHQVAERTPDAPPGGSLVETLPEKRWMQLLNNEPDRHPHLLLSGKSGSGKTTLALALLTQRTGSLAVITPKSEDVPLWGAAATTCIDYDGGFSFMNRTMQALYKDLITRTAADEPLTIVI
ncbi:MAG: hypothetical protein HC837_13525, partial [Chloroflexaceae bacterium]|nr:hypothetical protein [Chloroflexaceae bacterium]